MVLETGVLAGCCGALGGLVTNILFEECIKNQSCRERDLHDRVERISSTLTRVESSQNKFYIEYQKSLALKKIEIYRPVQKIKQLPNLNKEQVPIEKMGEVEYKAVIQSDRRCDTLAKSLLKNDTHVI